MELLVTGLSWTLVGCSTLCGAVLVMFGRRRCEPGPARAFWTSVLAIVTLAGVTTTLGLGPAGAIRGRLDSILATAIAAMVVLTLVALQRARGMHSDVLFDGAIIGTSLAICLIIDSPFAMIGPSEGSSLDSTATVSSAVTVVMVVAIVCAALSSDWSSLSVRILAGSAGAVLVATIVDELMMGLRIPTMGVAATLLRCAALVGVGLAALDPDARHVVRPSPRPPAAWSGPRVILVVGSFVFPLYCLGTRLDASTSTRFLLGGLLVMIALLVARARSAIAALTGTRNDLEFQATHDVLTGLPNRAALLAALIDVTATGRHVAVYFVDLDGFKLINDSLGHGAGDQLLRTVSERLGLGLPQDVLVYRLGGDEFVLVQPDPCDTTVVAFLVSELVAAPMVFHGLQICVRASIGVTESSGDPDQSPDDLLREADTAMYRAKAGSEGAVAHYRRTARDGTGKILSPGSGAPGEPDASLRVVVQAGPN